nr:MAG TPA: hypothetical protein [Caudoviricetes sp.]
MRCSTHGPFHFGYERISACYIGSRETALTNRKRETTLPKKKKNRNQC